MQWEDKAIVLNIQAFSEDYKIVTLLTEIHGLYKGLVKIGKKNSSVYHVGNNVFAKWKARISDHLGFFSCELEKSFLHTVMYNYVRILALNSITFTLNKVLPPRDININFYSNLISLLETLAYSERWLSNYIATEVVLLEKLGFGLSLQECAVTGSTVNLKYISPKSGKAVCAAEGKAYHNKLFILPNNLKLIASKVKPFYINPTEFVESLNIINYFLEKHCFKPYNLEFPEVRKLLGEAVLKESINSV